MKPQAVRFLIVVEGVVTESEYFSAIKRRRRMKTIDVLIETGHTDPIGIVDQAKKRRRQEEARGDSFDQVWCVFDTEAKQSQRFRVGLLEAIAYAKDAKDSRGHPIELAISNPCFELWIWLHENDQTAWIASTEIQRKCTRIVDKHICDVDGLLDLYPNAKLRAKHLDEIHLADNKAPEDRNPSSGVYKLIDAIQAAFPRRG